MRVGRDSREPGLYLEQEKGRDDVVGHVEVVPHAGLVERKPFEREHQLGSKERNGVQQAQPPQGPQGVSPHLFHTFLILSVISQDPLGSPRVKMFLDRETESQRR